MFGIGVWELLIILVIFFSTQTSNFLQVSTLFTIAREAAVVLVVAIGLTFVILMGSIDLSVGATVTLAGLVTAKVASTYEWGAAMLAGVAVAAAVGVVNGVLFSYAKVPSFLATLGTSLAIEGPQVVAIEIVGPVAQERQVTPVRRELGQPRNRAIERGTVVNALERERRGLLVIGHGLGLLRRGDRGLCDHRKRARDREKLEGIHGWRPLLNEKGRPDRDALTRYA